MDIENTGLSEMAIFDLMQAFKLVPGLASQANCATLLRDDTNNGSSARTPAQKKEMVLSVTFTKTQEKLWKSLGV